MTYMLQLEVGVVFEGIALSSIPHEGKLFNVCCNIYTARKRVGKDFSSFWINYHFRVEVFCLSLAKS